MPRARGVRGHVLGVETYRGTDALGEAWHSMESNRMVYLEQNSPM